MTEEKKQTALERAHDHLVSDARYHINALADQHDQEKRDKRLAALVEKYELEDTIESFGFEGQHVYISDYSWEYAVGIALSDLQSVDDLRVSRLRAHLHRVYRTTEHSFEQGENKMIWTLVRPKSEDERRVEVKITGTFALDASCTFEQVGECEETIKKPVYKIVCKDKETSA